MRDRKHVGDVTNMAYHRNGICGEGFWTIIFSGTGIDSLEKYVATVFREDPEALEAAGEEQPVRTAVLRLSDLAKESADGCMRGEYFHDELMQLIADYKWPHERHLEEALA